MSTVRQALLQHAKNNYNFRRAILRVIVVTDVDITNMHRRESGVSQLGSQLG